MEWINLHGSVLDSPEFVGEEPTNQATWLKCLHFCAGQENGGRIKDCKGWKDRKWQQLVRVTKREVMAESELLEWDGDDLLVLFYPSENEATVKAKREIARTNGARGGRPKKKPDENPQETDVGFSEEPKPPESGKAKRNGSRKEKEIEMEVAADAASSAAKAEALVSACPRPDLTMPALMAAKSSLERHEERIGFDEILAATKAATDAVKRWPENERIAWAPGAAKFFDEDQWRRAPESWESRRSAKVGLAKPGSVDVGGRKPELLNLDDDNDDEH